MAHENLHEEMEELVPLLALDALSPEEELSVRAHVDGCRTCSALLREHLETAAGLAFLAGPVTPPARLKEQLMARVATEPQASPVAVASAVSDGSAASTASPAAGTSTAAASRPVPARTGRRGGSWLRVAPTPRWRRLIAGLAAACVLLVVANVVIDRRMAEQDQQIAEQRRILELIAGPPTMTMQPAAPGIQATGHVFVKGDQAAIVLTGLDETPEGVYEVWVIRGGKPSPLTPVDRSRWQKERGQAVVLVEGELEGAEGMAVSLEPSVPPADASGPRGPILLKT